MPINVDQAVTTSNLLWPLYPGAANIGLPRIVGLREMMSKLTVLTAVLLLAIGCAVNPVTGREEVQLLGTDWEIAEGSQSYVPLQQHSGGLYRADPALADYVASIGQRLAAHAERRLPYEFVVVNSDEFNAWALPGGKIGVNRGLLVALDSEAELAALLGHEIIHAAARHGAKEAERTLLTSTAIAVAEVAWDEEEYADLALAGAQLGGALLNQRYSREAEREADYHGMRYMVAAGYNPQGAVALQQRLVDLSQQGTPGLVQRLFASHPPSLERVANNRASASVLGGASGTFGRERYREAIAHAKSKQPAYQLAAEARALAQQGAALQALNKLDQAITLEPNEGRFHGLKGDVLRAAGRYQDSLAQYDRALQLDATYYGYYLGRGLALGYLGQRAAAVRYLHESNSLFPTTVANNALAVLLR